MEKQNNPPSQAPHPNAGLEKKGKQVSSFKQCLVLIARYFELIWNDKQRLLLLFIQPIAIAFLLAVVAVDDTFITYEDTRSIMFALFVFGHLDRIVIRFRKCVRNARSSKGNTWEISDCGDISYRNT